MAKYIDFIEADALSSIDANFDVTFWFGKKITVFWSIAKLHIKFQKENDSNIFWQLQKNLKISSGYENMLHN